MEVSIPPLPLGRGILERYLMMEFYVLGTPDGQTHKLFISIRNVSVFDLLSLSDDLPYTIHLLEFPELDLSKESYFIDGYGIIDGRWKEYLKDEENTDVNHMNVNWLDTIRVKKLGDVRTMPLSGLLEAVIISVCKEDLELGMLTELGQQLKDFICLKHS
jgi:hypothetical protein